jgi:large conductance mechanosensitive channel
MLKEFRDFIKQGDVVTIAVGLVMALFFAQIINAILEGIIMPLIAAIFDEPDFSDIGFYLRGEEPDGTFMSIGLVINAVIIFLAVAFILFLIVKVYNKYVAKPEEPGPSDIDLLTEIRDELRNR